MTIFSLPNCIYHSIQVENPFKLWIQYGLTIKYLCHDKLYWISGNLPILIILWSADFVQYIYKQSCAYSTQQNTLKNEENQ